MNLQSQETIVIVIVALAGAYLVYFGWRSVRRRSRAGCGSCGTCPASSSGDAPQVVDIGQLTANAKEAARAPTHPQR